MRTIKHPLSGALYDLNADGSITVTAKDGRQGVFRSDGVWMSGEVKHADAHLCGWIGGPQVPSRHAQAAKTLESSSS